MDVAGNWVHDYSRISICSAHHKFQLSNSPVTDVKSLDFRCNVGGLAVGAATQTLTVASGSTLGFALDDPGFAGCDQGSCRCLRIRRIWELWVQGQQISAVADGVKDIAFPSNGLKQVTFTVPASLPAAQYLVRIEHVALHSASTYGGAQFYISYGQVKVTGSGTGKPGPLVAIPGVYTGNEQGLLLNICWPPVPSYTHPGPAV